MSRKPRQLVIEDNSFFHTAWRCHGKRWLLQAEWAKELYYNLLLKYKDKYNMIFHAYHFMDNHVHLTGKLLTVEAFSAFFRVVNNLFSRKINKVMNGSGQVVMDRLLSPMIQSDLHMLRVMAYIDLNGVRAGKHERPEDAIWSSYGYYAFGKSDPLLVPVPTYLGLGNTDKLRQKSYRNIVEGELLKVSKKIAP